MSVLAQPKIKRKDLRPLIREMAEENYTESATLGKSLLIKYPNHPFLQLQLGISYLNLDYKEDEAIHYLKSASTFYQLRKKPDNKSIEAHFYLGQAYHINHQFEEALKTFNALKSLIPESKRAIHERIDKEITYNENAIRLKANPINFHISNLGSAINSEFDEHSAIVSADESTLIFTSNRPGTGNYKSKDGLHFEDIYQSIWREGTWLPAMNMGKNINTQINDASVSLSPNGQQLLIYRHDGVSGDLVLSTLNEDGWSPLKRLPKPINTQHNETHGAFSNNGRTLHFSSDRPGGFGGKDIYVSHMLPDGGWGIPQNLGSTINTGEDEESPYLHPDGKTLYFSSMGHDSMGGYDIFSATAQDSSTWSKPVNIGYPINTPDDDLFYIPTADGQRVYYASKQDGGLGRSDIFLIEFPESDPRSLAVVSGFIFTTDGNPASNAFISVSKSETGEEMGIYRPNPNNGKFIFILPINLSYTMTVSMDGQKTIKQEFAIPSRSDYKSKRNVHYLDPLVMEALTP
jgi:hypothetical protein